MAESPSQSSPYLISLQELDPSPVDSPLSPLSTQSSASAENPYEKEFLYSAKAPSERPATPQPARSSTYTLGLNNHSLTSTLLFLQKYSTLPFVLYLGLHVTNTSLIPLITRNLQSSDDLLLLTRPFYQSPALEPLVILAPLATHILSGIVLRIHRRRLNVQRYGAGAESSRADRRRIPWPELSTQALLGYLLVPLVAGHSFVNRWLPLWLEGGSSGVGLRFVAHGFAKHPLVANLGYGALVGVGVWHFVGGAARWLRLSEHYVAESGDYGMVKRKKRRRRMVNAVAALAVAVWGMGGLGVVGRGGRGMGTVWEVRAWDDIYTNVPIFGAWL